jgi:acetyltransferase-like isoleucine patch superfamily enzyme
MIYKIKKYSFLDITRKAVYVLLRYIKWAMQFLRKLRFYFLTKCWMKHILGRVYVNTLCINMKVGKNATLYPYTIFEIAENAALLIGNNFTLSYGAIIACNHSIKMGNDVMIGEYSSIRDTTHSHTNSALPYCSQPDISGEIVIGNNVWIGRGVVILPGSIIEDGVIIGAHSLVKGHLKTNCIYAGSPLKMIRQLVAGDNSASSDRTEAVSDIVS